MTLKMDSRDDRIGRSVSWGEMVGFPGVMPPTPANQRSGNRKERDDEVFDLSGFHNRLVSGLDRGMETAVLEAPRVLKTGMPVDDALGGGIGLGKLSVIGGAHEDVSNVLVHAALVSNAPCSTCRFGSTKKARSLGLFELRWATKDRKILRNDRSRRFAQRCDSSSAT